MNIVLLATAWGPKEGGINAFNEDFAIGLGTYPAPDSVPARNIFCLVPTCTEEEIAAAKAANVTLLPVAEAVHGQRPFDAIATEALARHSGLPALGKGDIWVGHDLHTGAAAIEAATATGSEAALILHTNPEEYKFLQSTDIDAEQRHRRQRDLFRAANHCFAVGPSLRDALRVKLPPDATVHMLIPGLPEISANTATDELRAIAFGRLDREDDIVKQGLLVAAAYGAAVRAIRGATEPQLADLHVLLRLFGACNDEQLEALRKTADEEAGRIAPLLALPYEVSRSEIHDALAQANLALVPSFHDGFALTGWEAIGAETPLILSRQTGLWKLLKEAGSPSIAEALVQGIDIEGARPEQEGPHYTSDDVSRLADAIVRAMMDRHNRIRDAAFLKELLIRKRDGCSWHKTAEEFLIGIGKLEAKEAAEAPFVGDWVGFFIEGPPLRPAKVLQESIGVRRHSGKLRGSTSYEADEGRREEEMSNLDVRLGVLNGHTTARSGYTQGSWCQFQLARRSSGRLLDGVVSWSSTVQPAVDWSRYIWVEDKPGNEDLLAFAEAEMELERVAVEQRFAHRHDHPYPGEPGQLTAYSLKEAQVDANVP